MRLVSLITKQMKIAKPAKYSHSWLENNGKNDWEYRTTYIQEKNKSIWEVTLQIAQQANGEKTLYDVLPIKIVEYVGKSTPSTNNTISQETENVKDKNAGAKFSLRVPVEESKDLIAVHNMQAKSAFLYVGIDLRPSILRYQNNLQANR